MHSCVMHTVHGEMRTGHTPYHRAVVNHSVIYGMWEGGDSVGVIRIRHGIIGVDRIIKLSLFHIIVSARVRYWGVQVEPPEAGGIGGVVSRVETIIIF